MAARSTSLTPKLRFPEFRRSAGWNAAPLSSVLSEERLKSDGKAAVHSVSLTKGVVPQIEHMGRSFSAADTSHYSLVRPFDVIYTKSPLAIFKLGIVKQHRGPRNALVSPLYGVFTPVNRHVGQLIEAHFDSPSRSMRFLEPLCQKGAKNTIQISNDRFLSGELFLPHDEEEQRKIAACLTSLDELLAAEGRKLEALRAHKRGLMQQLFPREGESRPRLRFPEFRDAPEWADVPLSRVVEVASGQVDPTEPPYCGLPHVGGENIESHSGTLRDVETAQDLGLISGKYPFDERDILYSKIRPALNKVAAPDFQGICSADIYPIRPSNSELVREYLLYLLRSEAFVNYATRHSARSKIPKVNREALLAYAAPIPARAEQQRIAACLSSLDALIAAQSRKLDGLRAHKKGLMQQLFPSPEGD